MNRLAREIRRLYVLPEIDGPAPGDSPTRVLVLELARPADWDALAGLWRGVQADLDLPAPAIAANGVDGLQLWFSLQQPIDSERGRLFLQALCRRYLPELPPSRLAAVPARLPGQPEGDGRWSAFIAPDLTALFAETPWLDLPPNDDGQADLLAPLACIRPAQWDAALALLQPAAPGPAPAHRTQADSTTSSEPAARQFLLSVMNDPTAPLALRMEAAKALL